MDTLRARAVLRIRHERPFFDKGLGHLVYRPVSPDEEVGNILTDGGRVAIHTLVYGTAIQKANAVLGDGLHFVGVSNDSDPPAAGDTSLAGELSGNGFDRAQGTVVLPTGSGTLTTISHTFTNTGLGNQSVQKTALFDAPEGGNMAHEILFTQRVILPEDTLTLTFQITVT